MKSKQSWFKNSQNGCTNLYENQLIESSRINKESDKRICDFLSEPKWDSPDKISFTENSEVKYDYDSDSSSSDTKVSLNDIKNTPKVNKFKPSL